MNIILASQFKSNDNVVTDSSPTNHINRSGKIAHILNKSPGNRWNHLELYDQKHLKIQYPQKILQTEEKIINDLKSIKLKEEEIQQNREIQKLINKSKISSLFKLRQQNNRRLYSRLSLRTGTPQNYCPTQINERLVNLSKSKQQFKPDQTNEYAEFRDIPLIQLNSLDLIKNPTLVNFLTNNKFVHKTITPKVENIFHKKSTSSSIFQNNPQNFIDQLDKENEIEQNNLFAPIKIQKDLNDFDQKIIEKQRMDRFSQVKMFENQKLISGDGFRHLKIIKKSQENNQIAVGTYMRDEFYQNSRKQQFQ